MLASTVEFVVSILSEFGIGAIILFFIKRYFDRKDAKEKEVFQRQQDIMDEIDTSIETIRLLAYTMMSEETERLLDKGFATTSDRRIINEMYRNYHEHGWNGDMETRMDAVNKLPLTASDSHREAK